MIRFSVIIPTLNEEKAIGKCIEAVRGIETTVEIIVSDGGSADRTVEVAESHGVVVCRSPKGRGRQMNAGASLAKGDILLFLHADTFPPGGAFNRLTSIFSDSGVKIGVFGLSFDMKHWLLGLGLLERLSAVGPGWLRFGDSSITIRRDFFQSLGGFPDQPLFEDLELLRRAARITRIKRIPMKVVTSARRFVDSGVVRQLIRNVYYTARYFTGTSPETLAEAYERGNRRLDRKCLLMMVRYPEPGRVKSRLAADLGEQQATAIYRTCADTLFAAAITVPDSVDKILYCADARDSERIVSWTDGRFHCIGQPEGGLTTRLENGFTVAFKQGAGKVVIVASDVPGISSNILDQAFNALARHDVVIGPSTDGGYYLIGLKHRYPQLFRDIAWSTPAVLEQTLRAAEKSGLSVLLLPPLQDIDTADDWCQWLAAQSEESEPAEVEYAQT